MVTSLMINRVEILFQKKQNNVLNIYCTAGYPSLDHKHVGSLHAADAQMAIENARDVYTRRMEGVSIWVVQSKYIHATAPEEAGELFEPAEDKIYRHPTFYKLPDEVNQM